MKLNMLDKVLKTIEQYSMLIPGDRVLAAVSGGADSVALLITLNMIKKRYAIDITSVHLNHRIRGAKADKEAAFVKNISENLGIDCILGSRDVPLIKNNTGMSMQEAAREARYQFFFETAERTKASKIAIGHNSDDQAETFLMRLLRGASLKGLCAIPPVRDNIIRPLIHISRKEIELFLKNLSQPFIPDESSSEMNYLRNRVRHHLIPLLREQYNPETVSIVSKTAELLRNDYDFIDKQLTDWVERYTESKNDEIYCNISKLLSRKVSLWGGFIIKIIDKYQGNTRKISYKHIEEVKRLIISKKPSGFTKLPGSLYVLREYENLVFTTKHPFLNPPFLYRFNELPDKIHIKEINRTLKFKKLNPDALSANIPSGKMFFLDLSRIEYPVSLRNWVEGDRFSPEGFKGTKKLKDFFTDLKIPARLRKKIPILLFGDKIACICGFRVDEHYKVDKKTSSYLQLTLE